MSRGFQTHKEAKVSAWNGHRLLWVIIVIASLALYFLINRLVSGGAELSLPIDQFIPLVPVFIIPYVFGTVVFSLMPVWAAIHAKSGEFEAYAISILIATLISYLIYIVFPTFVTRPEILSQDLFSKAIGFLYETDRVNNAAPSGHTFYTLLSVLYLARWRPAGIAVWIVIGTLIIASTLFTRQHYVLDLVSGLLLGFLAYFIGRFIQNKWNLSFAS